MKVANWRLACFVVAAAALWRRADGVGSCAATPKQLTWSCGGICTSYIPCLVFNASDDLCSDCESDSDGVCAYRCFSTLYSASEAANANFLIPYGSYKSLEEQAARSTDSSYDDQLVNFENDTDTYPSASNDALTRIAAADLSPDLMYLTFWGGSSASYGDFVRGKVVDVALEGTFVSGLTNLSVVNLYNMNLQNETDLSSKLPAHAWRLSLRNDLITSFPYDESSFSALQILDLAHNYVSEFDGLFPLMYALYLNNNSLTSFPEIIFSYSKLEYLHLAGNPFEGMPQFTRSQVTFLQGLSELDLHLYDFAETPNCGSMALETVHNIVVCVSDESAGSGDATVPENAESGSTTLLTGSKSRISTTAMVGIIAGGVVAAAILAVAVFWRVNRQHDKPSDTNPTSGTELDHTGSSYIWNDEQLCALRVDAEDIEDVRKIGGGAYGVVWLVRYRSTQLLASKRLQSKPDALSQIQAFVAEIKLIAQFDHANIVKFKGVAWTFHNDIQALFEYMEHGDLHDYLSTRSGSNQRVWTPEKFQIACDVADALVYVHSFVPPVVHRDLKSRNVLLSSEWRAKLTDFGAARVQSENNTMTAAVGTGFWLAPEVLDGSPDYGPPADVFSFGVLLSELDTHELPYDDVRGANGKKLSSVAILQMVAIGQARPSFSSECPQELQDLAANCMAQDPAGRPAAPQVAYELRQLQKALLH